MVNIFYIKIKRLFIAKAHSPMVHFNGHYHLKIVIFHISWEWHHVICLIADKVGYTTNIDILSFQTYFKYYNPRTVLI